MFTIKGFTTKKDVPTQLKEAGVKSFRLPFSAKEALSVENNPLEDFELKDCKNEKQEIIKLN